MEERKYNGKDARFVLDRLRKMGIGLAPLFEKHGKHQMPTANEWFSALEGSVSTVKAARDLIEFQEAEINSLKSQIKRLQNIVIDGFRETNVIIDESLLRKASNALENAIEDIMQIERDVLKSKSRKQIHTRPRYHAASIMHEIHREDGASLSWIGDWLGGRDHSTIIHSLESHDWLYKFDRQYKAEHNDIKLAFVNYLGAMTDPAFLIEPSTTQSVETV